MPGLQGHSPVMIEMNLHVNRYWYKKPKSTGTGFAKNIFLFYKSNLQLYHSHICVSFSSCTEMKMGSVV